MSQNKQLERKIRDLLESLGVPLFRALPAEDMAGFRERVMKRARIAGRESEVRAWAEAISHPRAIHPWVRTVLLFGCSTNDEFSESDRAPTAPYGRVGRWLVYLPRFQAVAQEVIKLLEAEGYRGLSKGDMHYPLRPAAVRAGLARFRRNNFVYHERWRSWVGWWQVLTDAAFDYGPLVDDIRDTDICGDCPGHCIEACLSNALSAPYTFDGRRCVRTWSLIPDATVPVGVREGFAQWIAGCDACQEACPANERAPVSERPGFACAQLPADTIFHFTNDGNWVELIPLLEQEHATGQDPRFVNMLRRNAAIIFGATRDRRGIPALLKALTDDAPIVRGHAAWALGRLAEKEPLTEALTSERNALVRREIESAVDQL